MPSPESRGVTMVVAAFAVPVLDRWLVHAPLHRLTALLNGSALDRLRRGEVAGVPELEAIHAALREEPAEVPRPPSGPIAPDYLGFITTRACNIGCRYCDFGGPTAQKIDL